MNTMLTAVRPGLVRGRIEIRQSLTNAQDIWNILFLPTVSMIVMFFQRNSTVAGTNFSLGSMTLPSVLGLTVVFGGLLGMATQLVIDREDGTLLRAKAVPNGMLGYLVGRVVAASGTTLISTIVLLIPGLFLIDGVAAGSLGSWLTLTWVLLLGLLATMPIGAIIGSLLSNPRSMGLVMLPLMGFTMISGIFFPMREFPEWVQATAQVFPMYWLGLGMRSALLPDALAAMEIGQSWRHLETFGVLGVWMAFGLIVAPMVLRRMARRESGSSVAARREKAMQRPVM